MNATVKFLSLPDLQKLCCVVATLQENNIEDPRSRQRITCRELVLLHSDVLACPGLDSFDHIQVVMATQFLQSGILQLFGEQRHLQLGLPQCVSPGVLQCCLSFSLITRLAPKWNKAGPYLVAGRDFLSESETLEAVSMELSTTDGELCLSLTSTTVALPPTTLQDFDLPSVVRSRFCRDVSSVLDPSPSGQPVWCHVLPSMKKGQIINISRKLPSDGPFSSYRDLQGHWRRLYGYQLPDLLEDNVVYCHVYFKLLGEKLFSYPLSCIRLQPIKPCKQANQQGALHSFLADIREKLLTVCGFNTCLTRNPRQRHEATAEANLVFSSSSVSSGMLLSHHHPPPPPPLVPLSWSQPSSISTSTTSTTCSRMLLCSHHCPSPPPPPLVPLSWSQPPSFSSSALPFTSSTFTGSPRMLLSSCHCPPPSPPLLELLSWSQPNSSTFTSYLTSSTSTTPPKPPASLIPKVVPTFSTVASVKKRQQVWRGVGGGAKLECQRVTLPLQRNHVRSSSSSSARPPPFVPVFGRRPKSLASAAAASAALRSRPQGHLALIDPPLEPSFKFPPKKLPRHSARPGGSAEEEQASRGPPSLTALHNAASRGVRSVSAHLDVKLKVRISLSQEDLNQKMVSSLTQV